MTGMNDATVGVAVLPPADQDLKKPSQAASWMPLPMKFTGHTAEYFRIWIVNWALSILTLGIYSPWAKVRRERYMHQNTWLGDGNFDYTGRPLSILKGRLLVAAFVVAWQFAQGIAPLFAGLFVLAGLAASPWLIVAALRFRLHNTTFRGLRFRFHGTVGEAFATVMFGAFNFLVFYPSFVLQRAGFLLGNAAFGSTRFTFGATSQPFYRLYYSVVPLAVIGVAVVAAILPMRFTDLAADGTDAMGINWLHLLPTLAIVAFIVRFALGYLDARKFSICWNAVAIGNSRVRCELPVWRYTWVSTYGMLFTLLILSLYKPCMDIALARLRVGSLSLLPAEDLDRLMGDTESERAATGEAAADLLGFDIGI